MLSSRSALCGTFWACQSCATGSTSLNLGHDGEVSSLQWCGSHAANMRVHVQVPMQHASDLASASLQTLHDPCAYGNLTQGPQHDTRQVFTRIGMQVAS